jgi:pyrroline-5-carboxylate reductase
MASAMIQGLLKTGLSAHQISASDPLASARENVAVQGVRALDDNALACHDADVIVLAIKPQVAASVVGSLGLGPSQLVVSIMAGIELASLSAWLPSGHPIVRCMPNTPALVGAGMTALYANASVTERQRELAAHILQAAGETVWVDHEDALDAVTALSGSGPAYYFLLMEAMIESGTAMGLDETLARKLTLQTAYGAAFMALHSDHPPAQLRKNVTSPGGTTERALSIMHEGGMAQVVKNAVIAAQHRAKELAVEFGSSS